MKKDHIKILMIGLAFGTFLYNYIYFQKWNAEWWGTNVTVIWGLVAIAVGYTTKLVVDKLIFNEFSGTYRLPDRWFNITSISVVIFVLLGVYFTEPNQKIYQQNTGRSVAEWNTKPSRTVNNYYYGRYSDGYNYSRASRWDFSWLSDDKSSSSDSGSDDGLGEGLGFLLLILLVVIIAVFCAAVPHFWVVASIWGLTVLLLFYLNNRNSVAYSSVFSRLR